MRKTRRSDAAISICSLLVAFASVMVAMWSFAHVRLGWGIYNLAITFVALAVVVAARARAHDE